MAKATRTDPATRVRMPAEIKKKLKLKAVENNRSLSAEVLYRLERSLEEEEKKSPEC